MSPSAGGVGAIGCWWGGSCPRRVGHHRSGGHGRQCRIRLHHGDGRRKHGHRGQGRRARRQAHGPAALAAEPGVGHVVVPDRARVDELRPAGRAVLGCEVGNGKGMALGTETSWASDGGWRFGWAGVRCRWPPRQWSIVGDVDHRSGVIVSRAPHHPMDPVPSANAPAADGANGPADPASAVGPPMQVQADDRGPDVADPPVSERLVGDRSRAGTRLGEPEG